MRLGCTALRHHFAVRCSAPVPVRVCASHAVGMNYYDHCTEQNVPVPKEPTLFSKFANSIIGDGEPISLDEELTSELDFEVEL